MVKAKIAVTRIATKPGSHCHGDDGPGIPTKGSICFQNRIVRQKTSRQEHRKGVKGHESEVTAISFQQAEERDYGVVRVIYLPA